MSMIDRYRRPGGFVQLLKLLETCGSSKQTKFLEIIRAEDAFWADAIHHKILTFDRIFAWNDETLNEIFGTLQDLTVAIVLHGCEPDRADRIKATFTHARSRRVEDLFATNSPTANEIIAMDLKVIETVRQMAIDGYLRFDKLDPDLYVQEGIEERLANGVPHPDERGGLAAAAEQKETAQVLDFSLAATIGAAERPTDDPFRSELVQLRKRVLDLGKENTHLRHEVGALKNKLEQIKKIV